MEDEGNQVLIPSKVNEIFSKMCKMDSGNHPASIGMGRELSSVGKVARA